MTERDLNIPPIGPAGNAAARPRWSVMIPAFQASATIAETLASVLAQAPAAEEMQIAVLDNASTDDTLAVVERAAAASAGRVEVHRNPVNIGLVGNWNACLRQARGDWVHLLHADDYVQPGFYRMLDELLAGRNDVDVCVVRALVVDDQGEPERLARRLGRTGELLSIYSVAYGNEFYAPGVVVRRSAYERVGGFAQSLSYVPDWDMWIRLMLSGPGALYVNQPLACYRETAGNATHRLSRGADDLGELVRFGELLAERVPYFDPQLWQQYLKNHAAWAVRNWTAAGDDSARRANYAYWRRFASLGERLDAGLANLQAANKRLRPRLRRLLRPWKG